MQHNMFYAASGKFLPALINLRQKEFAYAKLFAWEFWHMPHQIKAEKCQKYLMCFILIDTN